jgi:hypothetical protein
MTTFIVATAIRVDRHDASDGGTGRFAHDTGTGVLRYHRLHQVEHRLKNGDIDHLPANRFAASIFCLRASGAVALIGGNRQRLLSHLQIRH